MTPARAPRSQLLPRCARQVELPFFAAAAHTRTVNDLSTLPGTGVIEAAGSVADISTLLPQGRAPPRRTLARAMPSPCCCSRWPPRSRRMGRPRAQKPGRAGPDPHAWEGLSWPSCTVFFALFVIMSEPPLAMCWCAVWTCETVCGCRSVTIYVRVRSRGCAAPRVAPARAPARLTTDQGSLSRRQPVFSMYFS